MPLPAGDRALRSRGQWRGRDYCPLCVWSPNTRGQAGGAAVTGHSRKIAFVGVLFIFIEVYSQRFYSLEKCVKENDYNKV